MNDIKTVSYFDMAEEYFKSAENLQRLIEKLKSNKELKAKNPKEYNSNLSQVRAIYSDCMQTGNLLRERAERYEIA